MLHIKFRYRDRFTMLGKWSEQECTTKSLHECIKFYGLDQKDVEYQIISIKEVENGKNNQC